MGYDADLAARVTDLIGGPVTERRMFGGLAFMIGGHMAVVVSGRDGIMVRVDPAESDDLVATTPARRAVMRGREMSGRLRVDADDLVDDSVLAGWVDRGVAFASGLPERP